MDSASQAVQLAVPPATIADPIHKSETVKPGTVFRTTAPKVSYRQHFTPATSNLEWLSCGEYELPAGSSSRRLRSDEERLLFMWKGNAKVN